MINGVVYFNNFITFKRYYCPKCNIKLKRIKKSKIVNSNSPEAKHYNFSLGDGFLRGDVKVIWGEYQCPVCNTEWTIENLRRIMKLRKKAKKLSQSGDVQSGDGSVIE